MKLRYFLGALVLVLSFAVGASAQESEVSGGGGGGITAAPGSGTAGRVPQFASTTSLVDSKMVTSGTNSGTWTLYDNTAVTGLTKLVITGGAGQGTDPLMVLSTPAGIPFAYLTLGTPTRTWQIATDESTGSSYFYDGGATRFRIFGGTGAVATSGQYWFNADGSAANVGLENPSSGIVKVTDGSTGQGGIGISDAAANTVTDALILRHATTDAGFGQDGFGTGLLWQGEDDAGNMNDMASIDAVYTDSANGSEDVSLKFSLFAAGAEVTNFLSISSNASAITTIAGAADVSVRSGGSGYLELLTPGAGPLFLGTQGAGRWQVQADGDFVPLGSNLFTIGDASYYVKDAYLGTSIQGTRTQAITDNAAAATFVTIAAPTSNTTVGGRIFYTITAIDAGTAIQTKTGTYSFGINNIAGTVTGAGTDVLEHSQLSTGTLAPTFSVNISGTNAQFQLVLDTSLDAGAETLKIEYRVQIDSGTATVTPAT